MGTDWPPPKVPLFMFEAKRAPVSTAAKTASSFVRGSRDYQSSVW